MPERPGYTTPWINKKTGHVSHGTRSVWFGVMYLALAGLQAALALMNQGVGRLMFGVFALFWAYLGVTLCATVSWMQKHHSEPLPRRF